MFALLFLSSILLHDTKLIVKRDPVVWLGFAETSAGKKTVTIHNFVINMMLDFPGLRYRAACCSVRFFPDLTELLLDVKW